MRHHLNKTYQQAQNCDISSTYASDHASLPSSTWYAKVKIKAAQNELNHAKLTLRSMTGRPRGNRGKFTGGGIGTTSGDLTLVAERWLQVFFFLEALHHFVETLRISLHRSCS